MYIYIYISHIIYHISYITYHISHIICHIIYTHWYWLIPKRERNTPYFCFQHPSSSPGEFSGITPLQRRGWLLEQASKTMIWTRRLGIMGWMGIGWQAIPPKNMLNSEAPCEYFWDGKCDILKERDWRLPNIHFSVAHLVESSNLMVDYDWIHSFPCQTNHVFWILSLHVQTHFVWENSKDLAVLPLWNEG